MGEIDVTLTEDEIAFFTANGGDVYSNVESIVWLLWLDLVTEGKSATGDERAELFKRFKETLD